MGSGFRVWTAGEVVSASNVNNYLQEQAVMSFAGTAARSSAVASPEEGMLSYLQDSDTYQGYDGAAWVNLGTLSGASNSGLVHIKQESFSAVTGVNVNDVFSATYENYLVVFSGGIASGNPNLAFRFRVSGADNSTSAYDNRAGQMSTVFASFNAGVAAQFELGTMDGNTLQVLHIRKPFAATPTNMTVQHNRSGFSSFGGGTFTSSTSFTGFTYYVGSSTISGVIRVYGFKD